MDVPIEVRNASGKSRYGRYVATEKLGAGGMGEVWQAYDSDLGRWVALKLLKGDDDEGTARFKREAQMAARLSHPNIAAIYEVGEDGGRHFIAMQLVRGRTLWKLSPAEPRLAARIVRDAARAVHYAHRQGIIHRDLKPDNIMVEDGSEQRVVVMDFGLAKTLYAGHSITVSGVLAGTPAYMSPEHARGETLDPRSDVYTLGATLHAGLTGSPPFDGDNPMAVLKKVEETEAAPIAGDLGAIVARAMAKQRGRRYATAALLADDLDRWMRGARVAARRVGLADRVGRIAGRLRSAPVAAAASIALAMAAAVIAFLARAYVGERRAIAREREERGRAERARDAHVAAEARVRDFREALASRSRRAATAGREAVKALEAALAVEPRADAWLRLAQCRRLMGEDARPALARALEACPAHVDALFEALRDRMARAETAELRLYMSLTMGETTRTAPARGVTPGTLAELRALFDRASAAGLDADRRRYVEALLEFLSGRTAEAESAVARYFDAQDADGEAFAARGRMRQAMGRTEEALADFTRASELNPLSDEYLSGRAMALFILGRYAEAAADLTSALAIRPDSVELLSRRARTYQGERRTSDAEADLARAVAIDPRRAATYVTRGALYGELRRYDEALADYAKALDLEPDNTAALCNRASIHVTLRNLEAAEADFERALRVDALFAPALGGRAILRWQQGRRAEAEADWKRVIETAQNPAPYLLARGDSFARAGRTEEALADLDRAVELQPKSVTVRYERARARFGLGRWAEAEADFTEVIAQQPNRSIAYRLRGSARRQLRRYADAEADFTRAIELEPQAWYTWGDRGATRVEMGRVSEGVADIEHALRLKPDDQELRELLRRARGGSR